MAFDIEQGNDPVLHQKVQDLKSKLMDALRKTGHVAEAGLGAVADIAISVVAAEAENK